MIGDFGCVPGSCPVVAAEVFGDGAIHKRERHSLTNHLKNPRALMRPRIRVKASSALALLAYNNALPAATATTTAAVATEPAGLRFILRFVDFQSSAIHFAAI